jgi:HK97 family phage portal protein
MASIGAMLRRRFSAQTIQSGIALTDHSFWRNWGGNTSFLGERVSIDAALKLSTVWACVRRISGTIATLPLGFYLRNDDGSRTPATKHPLYVILHNQPNAEQTAVVFWECVLASLLLWGNAYIEIIRNGANGISALRFLRPALVSYRKLSNGQYQYVYRDPVTNKERNIAEAQMMHIPAFSLDGVCGLSPIVYGVNVMGTAIDTDRTSAQVFKGALRSPGVLTMNMTLAKEQREQLREHIKAVSDAGGVMVVENSTGFQPLGFDPVSAELLASRAWGVEEMCRWYDMDPSMVGHGAKDSNWGTGLEQKMLWFISFTLRQWCVRIEQAVWKSLLTPVERLTYFAEFNLEGLLRGDSASRAQYYATMEQNGNMTRDEVRAKENLPAMGGNAAVLTVQSNMMPLDKLGENIQSPQDRRASDQATQAPIKSLHDDVRTLIALAGKPNPPQPINVDARTTVNAPAAAPAPAAPAPNITVTVPERNQNFEVTLPENFGGSAAPGNIVNNVHLPEEMKHAVDVEVQGVAELAQETRRLTEIIAEQSRTFESKFVDLEESNTELANAVLAPRKGVIERDRDGNPIAVRTTIESL